MIPEENQGTFMPLYVDRFGIVHDLLFNSFTTGPSCSKGGQRAIRWFNLLANNTISFLDTYPTDSLNNRGQLPPYTSTVTSIETFRFSSRELRGRDFLNRELKQRRRGRQRERQKSNRFD